MAQVFCNHCGKEIEMYPALTVDSVIGYGSKYDGDKITYRLCAECTDKLIETYLASNNDVIPAIKPEE